MTTTISEPAEPGSHAEPGHAADLGHGTTAQAGGQAGPGRVPARIAKRWWRRPWVAPLIVVAVIFVAFSVPPYLTGDPGRSRVPTYPDLAWYYPLLVAHIVFGSIALLTGCFQLWPWFRQRYPVAHRWMGRAYFFAGVFPAGVAVLAIAPLSSTGLVSQFGNTMLALLWLPISIAGYRMARQRRFTEHRRWMIRSFALTSSIVANRIWGAVMLIVFSPASLQSSAPGGMLAADDFRGMAAVGLSTWLSWIVNLLIAEWWLERTDFTQRNRARRRARTAD